jgi:hypothetical protein
VCLLLYIYNSMFHSIKYSSISLTLDLIRSYQYVSNFIEDINGRLLEFFSND